MALNISLVTPPVIEPLSLALAQRQLRLDIGDTAENELITTYISAARRLAEKMTNRAFFNQTWQRSLDNFPLSTSFDVSRSPADKWNAPLYGADWNRLAIDLPLGRALAVNSITYTGYNGTPQTLAPSLYNADLSGIPCRLTPSQSAEGGLVWPFQSSYLPGSVVIQWQAGSFVRLITELFTAPAAAPFNYTLQQKSVTAIKGVINSANAFVQGWSTQNNGFCESSTLTLPSSVAGQTLAVSYYVASVPADVTVALLLLVGHLYRNPEATTDIDLKAIPLGVQALLSDHVVEWTDYRPC